jgi:hypothetical protein
MISDAHKVETRVVGEAMSEALAHLTDAGLEPDAEENLATGSHESMQSALRGDSQRVPGGILQTKRDADPGALTHDRQYVEEWSSRARSPGGEVDPLLDRKRSSLLHEFGS